MEDNVSEVCIGGPLLLKGGRNCVAGFGFPCLLGGALAFRVQSKRRSLYPNTHNSEPAEEQLKTNTECRTVALRVQGPK